MSELILNLQSRHFEIQNWINSLGSFPITPDRQLPFNFELFNTNTWPGEIIKKIEQNKLLILFSSCLVKYNEWLFFKNDETFEEIMNIFSLAVDFWKKEENDKRKAEIEKESLYVRK